MLADSRRDRSGDRPIRCEAGHVLGYWATHDVAVIRYRGRKYVWRGDLISYECELCERKKEQGRGE